MPRRTKKKPPTLEEIRTHENVPYEVAARFIGWSDVSVRYALQQGRAPFGCAAQNPETGTWSYNISPEALIRYKAGELPYYALKDVVRVITTEIEDLLQTRMEAAANLLLGAR